MSALCVLGLASLLVCQGPDELLTNGGFEGVYENLPSPWLANSYGRNEFSFIRSTDAPREGGACLRVECARFEDGGVQFLHPGLQVEEGRAYTISFWVRGEIQGAMFCGLRQLPHPYTRYLARYLKVGPQWRRHVIVGEASGSDPACGLFLCFFSTGWIEVDAVSVRPGAHPAETAAIDAPPLKGNRLYNSGFELGRAGWGPLRVPLETTEGDSPAGGRHLAIPGRYLESQPFVTTPGQIYTLSGWFRRPAGQTAARLEMTEYADAGGDNPIERATTGGEVAIGTAWSRVAVSGLWDPGYTSGALLRLQAAEPGIECDGLQVEEGDLSDYEPRQPVEIDLSLPVAERYPTPGQELAVTVTAAGELPAELDLAVRLVDLWGTPLADGLERLPTNGLIASGMIRLTAPPAGIYRIECRAGPPNSAPGEVVIGVLPTAEEARAWDDGFHGIHAPPSTLADSPDLAVRISARAGCRAHRIHDFACWVQWFEVEPEPGQRIWFDEPINHLRDAGYSLLGTIARTPPWAAREPGPPGRRWSPSPPADLTRFAAYVRDTVAHYRDRIRWWEIWNEPYGTGFFDGPPEEYAQVLEVGAQACKEADPDCVVVGVCAYPGLPEWIERVLAVSGTASFDVFSYHHYYSYGAVRERGQEPPRAVAEVELLRELMRRHGGERPIWQTEGGVACPTFHSWLPPDGFQHDAVTAARTMARAVTLLRSAGVEKWFYYYAGYPEGGRGDYYTLGNAPHILFDYDGSPKATLLAWAAASQRLSGSRFRDRLAVADLRAYRFDRNDEQVAVVWLEPEGARREVPRPAGVNAWNMVGSPLSDDRLTLSEDPLYLAAPKLPDELLASLAR